MTDLDSMNATSAFLQVSLMEIQRISGFQLPVTTVTPADGGPPTRPNRHRGAHLPNRYRPPAENKTIDFRNGLETYISPRVVKRPNSSQGHRKPRSKASAVQYVQKEICSESKDSETLIDNKVTEKKFEAMANAEIKDIIPQDQNSNTKDVEVSETLTLEREEKVSTPSSPESMIPDPSMVCTCGGSNVVGTETKRHGDYASSQESKAWFEKTLQEYEDLKKSMETHIYSAPSERNELGADVHPHCVKRFWEDISLQDRTLSDIYRMDADEVFRKNECFSKMSRVGSPALSTYSCGCPARSFPPRSSPILDMDAVHDTAWKKVDETVAELRETNQALQQTVKELRERQNNSKVYDVKALAEPKANSIQCLGMSFYEPGLRKRVLGTLKRSVHRMESLMVALRDEQEKSRKLSMQLQGFLSASKDRTPQPTPPASVSWSRSTSPEERCTRFEYSHQFQTFPAISPACAPRSPERLQSINSVNNCADDYRQTSPTGNVSTKSSRSPVFYTIKIDSP